MKKPEVLTDNRQVFIRVHPSNMTAQARAGICHPLSFERVSDKSTNVGLDNVGSVDDEIRSRHEKPTARLEQGINEARIYINNLRNKLGLKSVPLDEMEVYLLDDENFEKQSKKADKRPGEILTGLTAKLVQPSMVLNRKDVPEYSVASDVFHELVHTWLDQDIDVYALKKINNQEFFSTESRRFGLAIARLGYEDHKLTRKGFTGSFLNEMANYSAQKTFTDHVLSGQSSTFQEEADNRNQVLKKMFGDREYIKYVLPDGRSFLLHRSNFHFNKDDSITAPPVLYQLIDDLSYLYGTVDGFNLNDHLLLAKNRPETQNKIRRVLDSKLGRGFYDKLRNMELKMDNIYGLLYQVQERIYDK